MYIQCVIPLHSLGLQAPTEDVKVVLEETFGGEEGIYILLQLCLVDQIFIFPLA